RRDRIGAGAFLRVCRPNSSFLAPRPNEKDRQTCVDSNDWPKQNSRSSGGPHVNKIERHEQTVGQHPKERPQHVARRPTSHSQRDQADAGNPTRRDTCASDFGAEQEPDHDRGIHKQDQASQGFDERSENKERFHRNDRQPIVSCRSQFAVYCRAMASRTASSGETMCSPLSSATESWTPFTTPLN